MWPCVCAPVCVCPGDAATDVKELVDIVQNQYPERLDRALLVNVPFIFQAAWKLIRRESDRPPAAFDADADAAAMAHLVGSG
eukprot:COSAG01_NODE_3905_length_5559_cov_13.718498_6_plen_82_part_00